MWEGNWNTDKSVFTGTYTFPDGAKFIGEAHYVTKKKRAVHIPGAPSFVVEAEAVEPHFEFTGSWEKDGAGYALHMPTPPDR